jgi:cell division protein FtsN
MSNKDYRELQVSSSHLVVIFIGILIVCGVSFLLGVNVGKRKAQLQAQASLPAPQVLSKVQDQPAAKDAAAALKTESQDKPAEKKALKPAAENPSGVKSAPQAKPTAAEAKPQVKETAAPAGGKTASPPPPLTAAKGTFSIQVGAFEKREDALQRAKGFDGLGYICRVLDPFPGDRIKYFRVRVGAFKTRAEAQSARDKLLAAGGKDYFIVQN